jgi:SAM-dependent methyltransferase
MEQGDLDAAFAAMRELYEGWLAEHDPASSQAVGWLDPEMQRLRFEVLALVMEGESPVSVADLGCGTGALFAHLAARETPPPLGAYTGYDVVPAMVAAARELHPDPRARFELGTDVAEAVDYVLASGAFTLRPGVEDADWEAHVHTAVAGLWERARRGLAFNLLGRDAEAPDPTVYASDPVAWARWCSGALPGARVALRYGPPLRDFTVLVRRAG